jgi:hypothetical protein
MRHSSTPAAAPPVAPLSPRALGLGVSMGLLTGLSMGVSVALLAAGCGGDAGAGGAAEVTRLERPGGGVLVRYGSLPAEATHRIEPDLVLGALDGEEWEMLGDIRGVDAGSDGAIYLLDFQPRLVRVFGADGSYLRTLGGPGDGPGEITQANGLVKEPGGLLWVNDPGKMRILGLRPDGTEVLRAPFPVLSFGFSWAGEKDALGRFWGFRTESVSGAAAGIPEPGMNEFRSRVWFHAVHPETEARDSVYVGERSGRSFVTMMPGGGWSVRSIPFVPSAVTLVDPEGGFWATEGGDWRVVRLDARGDTVLEIEAGVARRAITREDRERLVQSNIEQARLEEAAARELVSGVPDRAPALTRLFLDDVGRIWVLRAVAEEGEAALWDVFDRDGTHVASAEFGISRVSAGVTPRVRNGNLYLVAHAEEGFPIVVRAPVPF